MNELRNMLEKLGLSQYFQGFEVNDIDISLIGDLTQDDLKEIGITSLGHRKKILSAFQEFMKSQEDDPAVANDEKLDARAERREVTTVFADLTGYTTISRELETEDLHDLLSEFYDRFNDIVIRMGGTIDRHIGDCVMAVFGAPVSHGNDTERALRSTIEMHRAMEEISRRFGRELSVHIGIAAGNVLFSTKGYGQRKEQDFTLTGDTVNLASRLADQASGKETLIDDEVFMALSHKIDCDAPTTLQVKGFEAPVLTHRFKEFRRTEPQRPLIGRDAEMTLFREALDRCAAKARGETIYVCAEAGMGKSRLLHEVSKAAGKLGFKSHSALILDFGLGDAQNPINQLVRSLCGLGEQAQRSVIRRLVSDLTDSGTLDEISALFMNVLLGGDIDRGNAAKLDAMSDKIRAEGMRETLRRLIRKYAANKPQLLMIEDLHWADPAILANIQVLAEESAKNAVLLVITSRLDGLINQVDIVGADNSDRVRRIDLQALNEVDALMMLQSASNPSHEVLRQCVERAQGNPLFLEQLLRHAKNSDGFIPGSIQSLIQARFDQLAPQDKRIMQAAAVLGQRFSMSAVMEIAGISVYDERALIDASLIRPMDDGYLFAHALIRDAILRTILRDDLRALHKSAADWFKGRDIFLYAEHLSAALDPDAADAFLAAAEDARGKYVKETALAFASKGLSSNPSKHAMVQLLCVKGDVLRELGQSADSITAFTEAMNCADDPADMCRAQIGIVAAMRILDQIDDAYALLDKVQAVAEQANLLAELSEIHYFRGSLHFPKGNLEGCKQEHTISLDYAKRAALPERQALALSGLGDAAYANGRMFTAHSVIEQCLELCDQYGFGAVECANRFMLATVKIYMNETEQALHHALRSAELAAQVGLHRPEIVSRLTAGWILTSMSRYDEARSEIQTGLKLAEQLGAKRFEPFLEETLARIELHQGDPNRACEVAEGALVKLREFGAESFIGPWVMSTVALVTPDAGRRREVLVEAETLLAKGCVGHNYFRFYRNAMQACLNAGELDDAARYADALADFTSEEPTPWSDFHIDRCRALVAQGRGDDVTQLIANLKERAENASLHNALPQVGQGVA